VPLAKSLHRDIVRLGKRLENAAAAEEEARAAAGSVTEEHHAELLLIIQDIKGLLGRIDRDIPLLQLAITASGEKISSTMTPGISPSRMMQASALLSFADAHFVMDPNRPMQVGPSFTLSLYMLFLGHSRVGAGPAATDVPPLTPRGSEDDASGKAPREVPYGLGEGERKPIWQEVMHKARVRLCRTSADWSLDPARGHQSNGVHEPRHPGPAPREKLWAFPGPADGYSYHLEITEDLDDGRFHDGDGPKPQPYDGLTMAGIREFIPIHQLSKIFYTDTGRILNIGNSDERDNNPVLLLKRDATAKSPAKMREEWLDEPRTEEGDESQSDSGDESPESDGQDDVDRQLWKESEDAADSPGVPRATCLPSHLDPEWLALEVYVEDDEDEEDDVEDDGDGAVSDTEPPRRALTMTSSPPTKLSVDSKLMAQMRRISIRASSPPAGSVDESLANLGQRPMQQQETQLPRTTGSYITRAPFGAIASSLSLLEMLIRLTSLQEFQQTSHLAIPDHILTFFLEETSTTGLQGEAHWRMRNEAKRRMGFDPYTDILPRQNGQ
jgi:hypothetical protein